MKKDGCTLMKAVRIAGGISQAKMARECGFCTSTIARYENGRNLRAKTYIPIDMAFVRLMKAKTENDEEFASKLVSVLSELKHTERKWIRPKK